MNYLTFTDDPAYPFEVAILVPKLDRDMMRREYLEPSLIQEDEVIAYDLVQTGKKTSSGVMRDYLTLLCPILKNDLGAKYLLVGDGDYFKTLTGVNKAEAYLGYALPNKFPADMVGEFTVIYIPNYRQVFYNPGSVRSKITQATDALYDYRHGRYAAPGDGIAIQAAYPESVTDIASWLQRLHQYDALAVDVEAFSLKHYDAGVGTIEFAWSKTEGIAFAVDLGPDPETVRSLLVNFFRTYKGRLMWHNAGYDVTVLISQLFMKDLLDQEGLLDGLDVFFDRPWDDTKLITYLATNSCAGNKLSLKDQAQEYAGNYAVDDIKDIRKIPLPKLLTYNLWDGLSTWFVYEKHWDKMVGDQQLSVYEELFKPALIDIVQMQLTGMPLDMDKVAEARALLEKDTADAEKRIQGSRLVSEFSFLMKVEAEKERKAEWEARSANGVKVRPYTPGKFDEQFNPNSGPQMQRLLYELIELPVLERTDTKQPATGGVVLEKLLAYTDDQEVKDLLRALVDHKKVSKILTSFIPAMEGAVKGPDGWYWLFGFFNLGGTLSGRLSSSDPNLQNLPSNSFYAKIIKDCFRAPPGYLMIGLDFASLEDRISALTTKDPNKLAVYIEGFDGHSLRAQTYFAEDMPDIERAPEGAVCYEATIDGQQIWFHSQEQITYMGQSMTGAELWDRLANVRTAA